MTTITIIVYFIKCFVKEATTAKSELNNLQASVKTLNRKLNQTIGDKDAKISQLQQTLIRIYVLHTTFCDDVFYCSNCECVFKFMKRK